MGGQQLHGVPYHLGRGGVLCPGINDIKAALMSKTPWSPRGRKMVAYGFKEEDANDVVAFLKWIGETDLNGFPPKPDLKK
jgi:hypothetical protein